MTSFNLWAPELDLKPSPTVCSFAAALIVLALGTLVLLPLSWLWLLLLLGLLLLAVSVTLADQVFFVSDNAIKKVCLRDSGWWLKTRAGVEYPATLRPDSVVTVWFVLLNFNLEKPPESSLKKTSLLNLSFKGRWKKSVLILPDNLLIEGVQVEEKNRQLENFRRLRVCLRFGKGL